MATAAHEEFLYSLRQSYTQAGRTGRYTVDYTNNVATGKPLEEKSHVKFLLGVIAKQKRSLREVPDTSFPILLQQIMLHANNFWFGSVHAERNVLDLLDIQLHRILLLSNVLGIPFDAIERIQIRDVFAKIGSFLLYVRDVQSGLAFDKIYYSEIPKQQFSPEPR